MASLVSSVPNGVLDGRMNQERPFRKEVLKMVAGFRRFRERFFSDESSTVYNKLATSGQHPKTLMIGCSDSRVDPAILFGSAPGDMFVIRNVANLVPPFESSVGFHGVSSAIEFAVCNLKVENIVVLGHRQCGGIRSLFQSDGLRPGGFVQQWMSIAEPARNKVLAKLPDGNIDSWCRDCEKESIAISIENLLTFPFIKEAFEQRGLQLIGVYFDLESGQLSYYDRHVGYFEDMSI